MRSRAGVEASPGSDNGSGGPRRESDQVQSDGSEESDGPVYAGEGTRFVFLPNARNVRRRMPSPSVQTEVPAEPAPRTSAKWKQNPENLLKYVDDYVQVLKINTETVPAVSGVKNKRAVISENTFRRVIKKAESRGMVVNSSKTNMLCVSDSMSFRAEGHIFSEGGEMITSDETERIKILGFHIGKKPNVDEHVESLRRRFYSHWWILYHLKHHGFNEEELVRIFKTVIRPVFDYCAIVYHPMLTDSQDQLLESSSGRL